MIRPEIQIKINQVKRGDYPAWTGWQLTIEEYSETLKAFADIPIRTYLQQKTRQQALIIFIQRGDPKFIDLDKFIIP